MPDTDSSLAMSQRLAGWQTALSVMLLVVVFIGQFLLSDWWRFPLASVLMLGLAWLAFGKEAWCKLGLKTCAQSKLVTVAISGCMLVAWMFLPTIAALLNLDWQPLQGVSGWLWRFGLLFQVLNEEMLLRGLLLGWLRTKLSLVRIQGLTALVFLGLHVLLYLGMKDSSLTPGTLMTLICFCLLANLLVITSGHIWFGFSLHAAWNFNRFGAQLSQQGHPLSEAQSFNAFEGRLWPFALSLLVLVWFRHRFQNRAEVSHQSMSAD